MCITAYALQGRYFSAQIKAIVDIKNGSCEVFAGV
jgi:hypothetical protein